MLLPRRQWGIRQNRDGAGETRRGSHAAWLARCVCRPAKFQRSKIQDGKRCRDEEHFLGLMRPINRLINC